LQIQSLSMASLACVGMAITGAILNVSVALSIQLELKRKREKHTLKTLVNTTTGINGLLSSAM